MKSIKFEQLKRGIISIVCNRLRNGCDFQSTMLMCFGSIAANQPLNKTLQQWEDEVVKIIDATDIRSWKSLIRNFTEKYKSPHFGNNYSGIIPDWVVTNVDKCQSDEDEKGNWIIFLP